MPKLFLILIILAMLAAQVAGFSLHLCNVCESHLGSLLDCLCDEHGHSFTTWHNHSHSETAILHITQSPCQENIVSQSLSQPGQAGQTMLPFFLFFSSLTILTCLLGKPTSLLPGTDYPYQTHLPLSPRLASCIWLL